jgi:hypothetical protein
MKERGHLEDPGVDGRIVLRWAFRKWNRGIDCVDLAQERDRWREMENAIVYLRAPENAGKLLTG